MFFVYSGRILPVGDPLCPLKLNAMASEITTVTIDRSLSPP